MKLPVQQQNKKQQQRNEQTYHVCVLPRIAAAVTTTN